MMLMLEILCGLVLLVFGGEYLVRSASRISEIFGIPQAIIGLTVVSIGTSAPELFVSLFAALDGSPEIAISNVVGSNIFNVGVILSLCGLVAPLFVSDQFRRFDLPVFMSGSVLLVWLIRDGRISFVDGLLLLSLCGIYMGALIWKSRSVINLAEDNNSEMVARKSHAIPFFIFAGSIGVLVLGSRFLVSGAVALARILEVPESVIGLTIVAAGTSLPEVAASMMATLRGNPEIAIGNVIGSNIFNIFLILGISGTLSGGIPVSEEIMNKDSMVMLLFAMGAGLPMIIFCRFSRLLGAIGLFCFLSYLYILLMR